MLIGATKGLQIDEQENKCSSGQITATGGHNLTITICGNHHVPVHPVTVEYSHINTFCFHLSA